VQGPCASDLRRAHLFGHGGGDWCAVAPCHSTVLYLKPGLRCMLGMVTCTDVVPSSAKPRFYFAISTSMNILWLKPSPSYFYLIDLFQKDKSFQAWVMTSLRLVYTWSSSPHFFHNTTSLHLASRALPYLLLPLPLLIHCSLIHS
jgi:hypothetical protein